MLITNEARWDRVLRVLIGLILLGAGWMGMTEGLAAVALKLFGLYPLVTGLLGWSPVYSLLGFRTLKSQRHR